MKILLDLNKSYGRYFDRAAVRNSDEARINSLQELAKGQYSV